MRMLTWAIALTLTLAGPALRANEGRPAAPSPLAELRFQNISISVADLARASAWYQDVLGFKEVRTGEFPSVGAEFVFLEGNGMQIELIGTGKSRVPETNTSPPDHLITTGYKTLVFNTSNLTALTAYLSHKEVNIVWKEQKLADGLSSTMIHDIEGNLINIFGRSKE